MAQNYVLLERIELNADATTVSFQNIPQTGYTDLKVVISSRGTRATYENGSIGIRFNNDTGSNYNTRSLMGRGTSAYSETTGTTTFVYFNTATSTATANTYGNAEIYIPNYTSSNQKSVSMDAVGENNATNSILDLGAGIWTGTSAINRIDFIVGVWDSMTNILANSTFSLYGIAAVGTTPAIAPKADGGNVIATDGTYWYHAFLSNGTFTPQVGLSADVLVVAGGGGGGYDRAAGGGAGGIVYTTTQSLTNTNYTCTVGAGGAGGTSVTLRGNSGVNSNLTGGVLSLTAAVGGGGGGNILASTNADGLSGGSGGGAALKTVGPATSGTPGSATSGQGYAGGNAYTGGEPYGAGGGGGAGAVGGNATSGSSGAGGAGTNTYSSWLSATGLGVSGYIAGGGGGGSYAGYGSTAGAGGAGGGGAGVITNVPGVSGTANTGSGGGGGASVAGVGGSGGGAGGSGIIIIRYAV